MDKSDRKIVLWAVGQFLANAVIILVMAQLIILEIFPLFVLLGASILTVIVCEIASGRIHRLLPRVPDLLGVYDRKQSILGHMIIYNVLVGVFFVLIASFILL